MSLSWLELQLELGTISTVPQLNSQKQKMQFRLHVSEDSISRYFLFLYCAIDDYKLLFVLYETKCQTVVSPLYLVSYCTLCQTIENVEKYLKSWQMEATCGKLK